MLDRLLDGESLSGARGAYALMRKLAAGDLAPALAGALLAGLRAKGETAEEIRGFATRDARARRPPGDPGWPRRRSIPSAPAATAPAA